MVIMNILFAWIVRKRKPYTPSTLATRLAILEETPITVSKTPSKVNETVASKTNLLVQKVVAFLLVCYTPYLICSNYYYIEIFPRHDVKVTHNEVNWIKIYIETIYQYMFWSMEPFSWNKNCFPFFKINFLQNKRFKLFTWI